MTESKTKVDKSPERVRAMFGEIAPKYDFLNNVLSIGLAKRWRKRLVEEVFALLKTRVDPTSPYYVEEEAEVPFGQSYYYYDPIETLDVATGTGDVVIEERRQWETLFKEGETFANELSILGVDFVPEMLELARKKAPNERFEEADGTDLPFESERFDATTIAFGLRNMANPARGVSEMARVVRPGGVVAILEFTPTKFPLFAPIFRFYFHKILPAIGRRVAKDSTDAYKYLPESVEAFDSKERVLEMMRASGISNARAISLTFRVLALYIGTKDA